MKLVLTFDGGAVEEFEIRPGDLMHFERRFDMEWTDDLQKQMRIEHVMFLAWRSAVRTHRTELEFDEWADTVENFGGATEIPLDRSGEGLHVLPQLPASRSVS